MTNMFEATAQISDSIWLPGAVVCQSFCAALSAAYSVACFLAASHTGNTNSTRIPWWLQYFATLTTCRLKRFAFGLSPCQQTSKHHKLATWSRVPNLIHPKFQQLFKPNHPIQTEASNCTASASHLSLRLGLCHCFCLLPGICFRRMCGLNVALSKSVDYRQSYNPTTLALEAGDIAKHSRAACFIASFSAISAASLAAASLNQTVLSRI